MEATRISFSQQADIYAKTLQQFRVLCDNFAAELAAQPIPDLTIEKNEGDTLNVRFLGKQFVIWFHFEVPPTGPGLGLISSFRDDPIDSLIKHHAKVTYEIDKLGNISGGDLRMILGNHENSLNIVLHCVMHGIYCK